jgi:hypothetical protein
MAMASRPCKPDSDLKGLWRTLLGTPFPACGTVDDAVSGDSAEAGQSSMGHLEQSANSNSAKSTAPRLTRPKANVEADAPDA